MSRSVQPVMFADLHVVFRFEPVDGKITVIYCTGSTCTCICILVIESVVCNVCVVI